MGYLTKLTATEGYLHLNGTSTYCRSTVMLPSQTLDDYEEVAELPAPVDTDYPNRVERLLRERYTLSEELAVQRQRESKPEEFAAYFAYAEECKRRAKEAAPLPEA